MNLHIFSGRSEPRLYNRSQDFVTSSLNYNMAVLYLNKAHSIPSRDIIVDRSFYIKTVNLIDTSFHLFSSVTKSHPNNVRAWLHLAQCSVEKHKKIKIYKNSRYEIVTARKGNLQKSFIRTLSSPDADKIVCPEKKSLSPSLRYGSLCISRCLKLLDNCVTTDDPTEGKLVEKLECSPSWPVKSDEATRLRCSALACGAYLSLCLGKYFFGLMIF